jgi:hypothetical protein
MDALLVYASTFTAVFFLGVQSLNVNQRQYVAAGVTSVFISTGHIALYKVMPDSGILALTGYYLGGITGITAGIYMQPRFKTWLEQLRAWWARRRNYARTLELLNRGVITRNEARDRLFDRREP